MMNRVDSIDVTADLVGFSLHTRRAYVRWAELFLRESLSIAAPSLAQIPIDILLEHAKDLPVYLGNWLDGLKTKDLGKQSID